MKELSVFKQLAQLAYLPVYQRLIQGALELDVFSSLNTSRKAEELAEKKGWNCENTEYLLGALTSIGFLKAADGTYVNTEETGRYLSTDSPDYAGGFLMTYMQEGFMPVDVAKLVKDGPDPAGMEQMNQTLDFARFGESFRNAQRGCRQQEILRIVRSLPENERIRKVLDIGCNTGLLGLAVIGDRADRIGVLVDMPPFVPLIKESAGQMGLSERSEVLGGNFLTDDLGGNYDLILAVSVMLFAKQDMSAFLEKLYHALAPGGLIICIGEGIRSDISGPWDMIMGFLPYMLQGMDMSVKSGEIESAAKAAGFSGIETRTELLCSGTQDVIILRK